MSVSALRPAGLRQEVLGELGFAARIAVLAIACGVALGVVSQLTGYPIVERVLVAPSVPADPYPIGQQQPAPPIVTPLNQAVEARTVLLAPDTLSPQASLPGASQAGSSFALLSAEEWLIGAPDRRSVLMAVGKTDDDDGEGHWSHVVNEILDALRRPYAAFSTERPRKLLEAQRKSDIFPTPVIQ